MDAANTQQEIDEIVDEPAYQAIINSSGWPTQCLISPGVRQLFARVDHKGVPQADTSYEAYWGWFTDNGFI